MHPKYSRPLENRPPTRADRAPQIPVMIRKKLVRQNSPVYRRISQAIKFAQHIYRKVCSPELINVNIAKSSRRNWTRHQRYHRKGARGYASTLRRYFLRPLRCGASRSTDHDAGRLGWWVDGLIDLSTEGFRDVRGVLYEFQRFLFPRVFGRRSLVFRTRRRRMVWSLRYIGPWPCSLATRRRQLPGPSECCLQAEHGGDPRGSLDRCELIGGLFDFGISHYYSRADCFDNKPTILIVALESRIEARVRPLGFLLQAY